MKFEESDFLHLKQILSLYGISRLGEREIVHKIISKVNGNDQFMMKDLYCTFINGDILEIIPKYTKDYFESYYHLYSELMRLAENNNCRYLKNGCKYRLEVLYLASESKNSDDSKRMLDELIALL